MIGEKTKTRRNIFAEIQKNKTKQTARKEATEAWYFVGFCAIGYVGYVLAACL